VTDIEDHLVRIADQNSFHPVREWILSAEWDGKSRLPDLYATVKSPHSLKELLLRRWLVSCVAAVFEPHGISAQGLVVFTGKQGLGKTTWIKSLVPVKEWIKEGAMLDPGNKDSVVTIIGHWIVELGELGSTFRKADLDALKAFITNDRDVLRPAYAEKFNKYARRTIFFGTVNDPTFLIDNENRRFWVIDVEEVNAYHDIDLQQLWAEVHVLYESGERFYLDREEQVELAKHNEEYKMVDPITDLLDSYVSNPVAFTGTDSWHEKLSATALLRKLGINNPSRQQVQKTTDWLKENNFEHVKEGSSKLYRVIVNELTYMSVNKGSQGAGAGNNKPFKLVK
jgi:putative DNA primase/helicase